jgi:hypothetical protein
VEGEIPMKDKDWNAFLNSPDPSKIVEGGCCCESNLITAIKRFVVDSHIILLASIYLWWAVKTSSWTFPGYGNKDEY